MKLEDVKGISDKRKADFNKLGVFSPQDLIKLYPKNYLDLTSVQSLEHAYNHEIILSFGKIITKPSVFVSARRLKCVKVLVEQNERVFTAIWFNAPYVLGRLKVGEEYLFYGRIKADFGGITIVNPSFEPMDKNYRLKGIIPVYNLKGNLTQRAVGDCVYECLKVCNTDSVIPYNLEKKYGLTPLKSAYFDIHFPKSIENIEKATERLAVEEFFTLISAFKIIKGDRQQIRANEYLVKSADLREFTRRFNFEFTDGQKKAVNEIYADMTSQKTMNRLIEGDVGSGKTAVALCAIYMAVKSGYQATMLAPTEILARQNYNIIKEKFPDFTVEFLSGSLKASEKTDIKRRIKDGSVKIVVGTHAVIQKDVEFYNLSLCVCDEQHRFGVGQRSELEKKGIIPDVLVMSATPIPRTLSLVFYGDLDITTIVDKPKGRTPVSTYLVGENKYEGMLKFITDKIEEGRQVYAVCPKIEDDDEGTVMSVKELFDELKKRLIGVKVGLMHGKMKDAEKEEIMQKFKGKEIDLLVSTTVVEVGIDVKNATVMVIYNAERFGLSQLHQLRGRVGRGTDKSYCFLYSSSDDEKARKRLEVVCENTDGFKIAEKDYEMRGSGDFLGERQSGKFLDELNNLRYKAENVFLAKKICDEAFENGEFTEKIKPVAIEKYERLKDVAMN